AVEFEPAPAITGTRRFACSTHHSTTRRCSSWLRVGLSPVVPTGTSPRVPSAICQSTSWRKAFSSSDPFLNGVTSAVKEPRKLVLAVMTPSFARGGPEPGLHPYRLEPGDESPGPSLGFGKIVCAGSARDNRDLA